MKIKLSFCAFFYALTSVCQTNPWLPPFEMNHDYDVIEPFNALGMTCTENLPDYNNYYNRYNFYKDNYNEHPTVTIGLNFNIWQKNDGSGNWTNDASSIARLYQVVEWMNSHYQNNIAPSDPINGIVDYTTTKIKFEINQIYFYQNSNLWSSSNSFALNNAAFSAHPSSKSFLNIHITGGYYMGASGFANIPSHNLSMDHYVVTFNNEAIPEGDWAFAGHLCHELGHNLGLDHTYNGANCNQSDPDYLSDIHNYGPCPHAGGWSCDPYSNSNTCTNNMMGGTNGGFYFSPMQIQRMHRSLALSSIRKYVKCENFPTENYVEISSNQTWDFNIKFYNSIRVKAGNTLTIMCKVVMSPGLNIIVEPGAKLILDGGVISTECNEYWGGIQVYGNSNLTQTAANQGTVILKNGATIEYAREAIQVWKYNDWSKTGGIVEATNSYFKNNWRSIAYYPYHSYSPVSGNEYPNKGRITNCEFTWDDDFIDINGVAPAITMNHVNGVLINGSDFIDNRTTNVNPHQRPNGIYTIDAGYKVVGRNIGGLNTPVHHDYSEINYDVCKFKNLQHGVYAMNSNSQFTVTVDHCKFEDMIYGIRLSSVDNALITRNKFDYTLNHPADITVMHELVFDKCTGYKVEGNKFNSQIPSAPIEGTLVYNSGVSQNRIYRNDYTNVMTGNYSNGQNTNDMGGTSASSGLQFLCNDHLSNQKFDEYVYTFPNANGNGQGIRLRQGSVFVPAGNTFSANLIPVQGKANIKSDDFDNILYFKGSGSNEIPTVIGGVGTQNSADRTCPSNFTNVIVVQQKSILSQAVKAGLITELQTIGTQQIQKATELDNLLQTGDSPYLHELVANLHPNNKQFVKTELLASSPYLSETLLKELGNKTPGIYPHAWYKDLILANIEVAQTKTFIDYLNSKNVPLPSGLINQINEQKLIKTTQRGEKIDFLTDLNTRKTVILDLLIQNELSDTVEIDWQAYNNWITQREDIICKSQMADMHLGKGEIIQCNEKLDYIDVHINEFMMDEIKQEMLDYSTFKKYVLTFVNEDGIIESLDSTKIQQLEYIANNFSGKSAVQARNLLCFHAGLCEDIEVVYSSPSNVKSAQATNESSEQSAYIINQT
ncbi:MAG: hypothetical protein K9G31_03145, partial [Crocinitomicaceae bacterium]|nr:hypothetical protein [Crocinitomicaceae bacterium]